MRQERTAGCPPARWEGLLRARHRRGLPWHGRRSPTSSCLCGLGGPPGGICRHGVGADPLSTRPVHQAVELSESPAPCYQNSAREAARSPSSLHLPHSAPQRGGGVVAGVLCWKVKHAVVILSPAATELKENQKFSLKKMNLTLIKSNIWSPGWHRVLSYMSKLTIGHIRNCSDRIPRWQESGRVYPWRLLRVL